MPQCIHFENVFIGLNMEGNSYKYLSHVFKKGIYVIQIERNPIETKNNSCRNKIVAINNNIRIKTGTS